ncbi:MAG: hypothetical protein GY710_02195 [Desulfobacteraceae bacterium]|nr:hypothetical protein [Desulfobacteraceae bacterium]
MGIEHLIYAAIAAAVSPFLINIFSGLILTVKNRFSDTPKFNIGSVFEWSQLPASGSIFPKSVMIEKSLTACHFLDISGGHVNGKYSITKSRWMISSASLIGFYSQEKVGILLNEYKDNLKKNG